MMIVVQKQFAADEILPTLCIFYYFIMRANQIVKFYWNLTLIKRIRQKKNIVTGLVL